ncbi:aspartate--ammonia ligase [Blautia pseudococcoides]|uniref:aspartate--ammonia ligase n=1 Tax=Blautia pseudococcoides TaxID=1796616 RepID=UPI00148B09B2|nr:aspartate--ammonia ligase [Blautia pseudococcoides]QJU17196.1 aspartate--ammonia ligase [Blautia pseudococcoides]
MGKVTIPENYHSCLSSYETQEAIGIIKNLMQKKLCLALNLKRVTAPVFVDPASGLNDDLNGVERPVTFDIPDADMNAQVVHSLAKWKRMALYRYDFHVGKGILCDMNAIRRDEELDNLHSAYVDQWDWEKIITAEDRTIDYLKDTVTRIVNSICNALEEVKYHYEILDTELCREVSFITSQELEDKYPDLTPKERENAYAKEKKTIFIMQIGDLLKSGEKHDGRAPDYDDWKLNGDLLFWHEPLQCAMEISSMGIRVDAKTLSEQLEKAGCSQRRELTFHKMLLNNELPLTIGGGIGQSRVCMLLLKKIHVGEVQSSIWDEATLTACGEAGVEIL